MENLLEKTDGFLRDTGMHPDLTDAAALAEKLAEAMDAGLAGEKGGLAMIPGFVAAPEKLPEDESVIVIDAGGTHLRTALCGFSGGKTHVGSFSDGRMPGLGRETDAESFVDAVCKRILPLTETSRKIGFSFSYPAEILPDGDGRVLGLNKELKITGIEGVLLGKALEKRLAELGAPGVKVSVINDSAAALLGGCVSAKTPCLSSTGLVLGTGFNTCFFEKGEKIIKLHNAADMIVNCESGNFSGAFRGASDLMTDAASEIPGDHLLEKMVSGAYLGAVVSNTARLAAGAGLLSEAFSEDFAGFSSAEADGFLRGEKGRMSAMCRGEDEKVLSLIARRIFERAGKIVGANIGSLLLHIAQRPDCGAASTVFAEGSTFWNSLAIRDETKKSLAYFRGRSGLPGVNIVRAENAVLIGAGASVFTSRY